MWPMGSLDTAFRISERGKTNRFLHGSFGGVNFAECDGRVNVIARVSVEARDGGLKHVTGTKRISGWAVKHVLVKHLCPCPWC